MWSLRKHRTTGDKISSTPLRDIVYITPLAMHMGDASAQKLIFSHITSSTLLLASFYGPSDAALVPCGPYLAICLFC
jgi:hypothetical protein